MSICIEQSCALPWTTYGCSRSSQVHNVEITGVIALDDAARQALKGSHLVDGAHAGVPFCPVQVGELLLGSRDSALTLLTFLFAT